MGYGMVKRFTPGEIRRTYSPAKVQAMLAQAKILRWLPMAAE